MRNPDERVADLKAQIAAHRLAEQRIEALCERRGRDRVRAASDVLLDYSERMVRAAIRELPEQCRYDAEDVLEPVEGGLVIGAAVTIAGDEIEIDFAGTSPQSPGRPGLAPLPSRARRRSQPSAA